MANLLNAIQQTNKTNAATSPENPRDSEQEKGLGELFAKTLNSSLKTAMNQEEGVESDSESLLQSNEDLGKVALAMNSVQNQVLPQNAALNVKSNEQLTDSEAPVVALDQKNLKAQAEAAGALNASANVVNLNGNSVGKINTESVNGKVSIRTAAQPVNNANALKTPVLSGQQFNQTGKSASGANANNSQKGQVQSNEALNQSIIRNMNQSFDQSVNPALDSSAIMNSTEWQIKDEGEISNDSDFVQASELLNGRNDVEIIDLKKQPMKAASSKLSTNDFMSLRDISKNPVAMGTKLPQKSKSGEKAGFDDLMAAMAPAHSDPKQQAVKMEATVMQTPGQKTVLAPESMNQIANQVNLLGQARQDGEIKIRLRPDHLGELQMNVRTVGQNVTVQIKAQSEEAKKMIEDSISSLREHLSNHNLSLASIDVVTQPAGAQTADQPSMQFDSNSGFNQFANQNGGSSSQEGNQQSGREFYQEAPSFIKPQSSPAQRARVSDTSRLDMIA